MTTVAGFLLASRGSVDLLLLLATVCGVSLVIACACVCNNYIDRGIDARMARTKKRALVSGAISVRNALVYAVVLGLLGFGLLLGYVGWLVTGLGLLALFSYVVLYGFAKRRGPYGTLVGTLPGALPLVAGYCAVTGQIDLGAWLLFAIMVAWQMPHFYAIAIYRLQDYKAAGIPVLPAVRGVRRTKHAMAAYVAAYVVATALLAYYGYAGLTYMLVMTVVGLAWLRLALQGFRALDDVVWAKRLFKFSLTVLLAFSLMISLDAWLP
jgi:protoheme IX farnesyltransferase